MTRDRIYISGPITGRPLDEARAHFRQAEGYLQRQGNRTINPMRMRLPVWMARHGHYRLCLLTELLWMAFRADCIYMLKGWHESKGAKVEKALATALGMPILYEQSFREFKEQMKQKKGVG